MRGQLPFSWISCLSVLLPSVLCGCGGRPSLGGPSGPQPVTVSQPVEREVVDFVDYTGRTDAPESWDCKARVTGYLTKISFKPGEEVKKGNLLFQIDQRPYQADLDKAKGQTAVAEAQYKLAIAEYNRAKAIRADNPGAISQQDLDKKLAEQDKAKADVEATKAQVEYAQVYLDFCTIQSPIDGQISRYYFSEGNLINQDTTLLTTVVSQDPMWAYFDADERTFLDVSRRLREGKIKEVRPGQIPVFLGVQNETGYPHKGYVDFVNNRLDPFTGTITLRGVFANPKPEHGPRLLRPGLFVRIRLPISPPHQALLVAEQAVGTNQGLKFLYVVDDQNKVEERRVTLGPSQPDGLRVVEGGLKPGEWVVVNGLQMVEPGKDVAPEKVPMPVLKDPAAN